MKFNVNRKIKEEIKIEAGDVLESIISGVMYLIVNDKDKDLYNYISLGSTKNGNNSINYKIGLRNPLPIDMILCDIFGTTDMHSEKFIIHKNSKITITIDE